jgi:hypothetical protein
MDFNKSLSTLGEKSNTEDIYLAKNMLSKKNLAIFMKETTSLSSSKQDDQFTGVFSKFLCSSFGIHEGVHCPPFVFKMLNNYFVFFAYDIPNEVRGKYVKVLVSTIPSHLQRILSIMADL